MSGFQDAQQSSPQPLLPPPAVVLLSLASQVLAVWSLETHPTDLEMLRALSYRSEKKLQSEEKVAVPGTARQTALFEELPHKATV